MLPRCLSKEQRRQSLIPLSLLYPERRIKEEGTVVSSLHLSRILASESPKETTSGCKMCANRQAHDDLMRNSAARSTCTGLPSRTWRNSCCRRASPKKSPPNSCSGAASCASWPPRRTGTGAVPAWSSQSGTMCGLPRHGLENSPEAYAPKPASPENPK